MIRKGGTRKWKPGQSGNPAGRPKGALNKVKMENVIDTMMRCQFNPAEFLINLIRTSKDEKIQKECAFVLLERQPAEMDLDKNIENASTLTDSARLAAITKLLNCESTGGTGSNPD